MRKRLDDQKEHMDSERDVWEAYSTLVSDTEADRWLVGVDIRNDSIIYVH